MAAEEKTYHTAHNARLGDICHQVTDGKHGDCQDQQDSGYYFISCKDVYEGKIHYENARQITEVDFLDTHRRTDFAPSDIVITNSGTIGRMAMAADNEQTQRTTFQKSVAILKPKKEIVVPKFLYYALQQDSQRLIAFAGGTAQKNLLLRDLRSFEMLLPPFPKQLRIASILSAYDDLIENNTRRIEILEEMARSLYREWFVNFRFPGHEKIRMVDSPLGKIPHGWELVALSDIAYHYRGCSYRSEDLLEKGGRGFVNLKCIERDGGFRADGLKRYGGTCKDTQIVRTGDIVIAVTDMTQERRLVARAARIPDMGETEMVFSMDLIRIVPKNDVHVAFLYGCLRYSGFPDEVKQYANGVNVLHLNPDRILQFSLVMPPAAFRNSYSEIAEAIYHQIDLLASKNSVARHSRDLLLPKLISGEIDVSRFAKEETEVTA